MNTANRICEKYEDLQRDSIVHEGYLEYFYGENLFKIALSRQYLVVLMNILNENREHLVLLGLYTEKSKHLWKYFQIQSSDRLNDRCRKLIEGKAGLFFMELVNEHHDKGEIFGVRSVPERKLWIEKFDETRLKLKPIGRSISDAQSSKSRIPSKECEFPVRSNPINYVPFKDNDSSDYLVPVQSLPNDYALHRSCVEQLVIQGMRPIDTYEDVLNTSSDISWEKIFYPNRENDFGTVLMNIGQTGVYLVRPQLTKSSANDHDYTLCVYDDGHIYKFGIYQFSSHQFVLKYREHEPMFADICELCRYYTSHPLRITAKDGLSKHLYLTTPYTQLNSQF